MMNGAGATRQDATIRTYLVPVTSPCADEHHERCSHQNSVRGPATANHPTNAPTLTGHIELNRPGSLNALDVHMVETMLKVLHEWRNSGVRSVIIRSSQEASARRPVFCSGGDVIQVVQRGMKGDVEWGLRYFTSEYHLNMLLATLSESGVEVVAVNDGITFGGGVGVSIHNRYQICTERTVFAMPECPIGLFPDVGGSYFLSRRGALGLYLALCGARLHGLDVKKAGFATHYVHSSRLQGVLDSISSHGCVKRALDEGERQSLDGRTLQDSSREGYQAFPFDLDLGEVFQYDSTVEEIVEGCRRKAAGGDTFWVAAGDSLGRASPTSLLVTLEMLRRGRKMPLAECLRQENRVIQRLTRDTASDFYRGVQARLIRKDGEPKWGPIRDANGLLEPLEAHHELQLDVRCGGRL